LHTVVCEADSQAKCCGSSGIVSGGIPLTREWGIRTQRCVLDDYPRPVAAADWPAGGLVASIVRQPREFLPGREAMSEVPTERASKPMVPGVIGLQGISSVIHCVLLISQMWCTNWKTRAAPGDATQHEPPCTVVFDHARLPVKTACHPRLQPALPEFGSEQPLCRQGAVVARGEGFSPSCPHRQREAFMLMDRAASRSGWFLVSHEVSVY